CRASPAPAARASTAIQPARGVYAAPRCQAPSQAAPGEHRTQSQCTAARYRSARPLSQRDSGNRFAGGTAPARLKTTAKGSHAMHRTAKSNRTIGLAVTTALAAGLLTGCATKIAPRADLSASKAEA